MMLLHLRNIANQVNMFFCRLPFRQRQFQKVRRWFRGVAGASGEVDVAVAVAGGGAEDGAAAGQGG